MRALYWSIKVFFKAWKLTFLKHTFKKCPNKYYNQKLTSLEHRLGTVFLPRLLCIGQAGSFAEEPGFTVIVSFKIYINVLAKNNNLYRVPWTQNNMWSYEQCWEPHLDPSGVIFIGIFSNLVIKIIVIARLIGVCLIDVRIACRLVMGSPMVNL